MLTRYETIAQAQPAEAVLLVTLDRPAAANALNTRMGLDLLDLFTGLVAQPDRCRAVVLTGAGPKAFCAGGDLKERHGMTDAAWQAQHLIFERMVRALIECPVPVVAAVNGAAYGGGCEIALACDFIYAVPGARFALTEVTLGIMPGAGGTQTLPRAVGERRAKELLLTGRPFSAGEAAAWGMVNRLCEPDALVADAVATAAAIAANAPIAVAQAKRALHHGLGMSLADGMLFEVEAYNRMVPTEDRREGVRAFNEKRRPVFVGR
ncbi:enoyl-CoA hydratase/isomerase family protein [Methylobacterium platani]|uniref:Enoyl-CoA hydratase n=2 Tax=Methylobacterium platani TaxID=427683 RepID=A0A179RZS4_9HYPH|nr:enoyl-CoA hydratase-related protein [Methylobacterium platani]KMO19904.1 enoyl-CoA hydratase [Methylobacterium platani JCM 14648]OAS18084.1 enoyl-CoA hydratase [Methylobacterium platani]